MLCTYLYDAYCYGGIVAEKYLYMLYPCSETMSLLSWMSIINTEAQASWVENIRFPSNRQTMEKEENPTPQPVLLFPVSQRFSRFTALNVLYVDGSGFQLAGLFKLCYRVADSVLRLWWSFFSFCFIHSDLHPCLFFCLHLYLLELTVPVLNELFHIVKGAVLYSEH